MNGLDRCDEILLPAGTGIQPFSSAYLVKGRTIALGDIPLSTTLEVVVRLLLPPQPAGSRLSIDGELHYTSPADNSLTTSLNKVTVRYDEVKRFEFATGAVKPVVRRVLGQMQATGILSTARAATRSLDDARQQSGVQLATMQKYASLLGKDQEAEQMLAESQDILGAVAMPSASPRAKAATFAAMKRQRGTKDFGDA